MAGELLGLPATAGLASFLGFILSFAIMAFCIFKLHAQWSRRRGPASATDWGQVGAALGLTEARPARFNLGGVSGQVRGLAVEAGAVERLEARTLLSVRLPAPLRPPLVITPRFEVGAAGEGRLSEGFEVTSSGRPQSGQVLSAELLEALRGCWQAGVPIRFDGQAVTLEIGGVGLEAAGLIAALGLMLAVGERLQRHFAAREEARGRATLVLGAASRAGELARWARLAHRAGLTPLPGGGGMTGSLDGQELQVIEQTRGEVATFVNTLGVSGGGAASDGGGGAAAARGRF